MDAKPKWLEISAGGRKMTTTREEFDRFILTVCFQKPPDYCIDLAWVAWQAAHLAGQRAMQERVGTLCDELEQHWSDYKDTALINGNVALSNAASGEPRAARAIKAAVLMMEVKPS